MYISVPLTEARRRKIALEGDDCRRASSRGLIPKAKVKTIKMTFVIVFGEYVLLKAFTFPLYHYNAEGQDGLLMYFSAFIPIAIGS